MVSDEELKRRHGLSFEQAEGAAPLPSQLRLGELSQELRARLWAVIHESLKADCNNSMGYAYVGGRWGQVLKDHAVVRLHEMIDEIESDPREIVPQLSSVFRFGSYTDVLGFVQFVLRHQQCPPGLSRAVGLTLQSCRAAYRLIENRTIVPIASPEEGQAIIGAVTAASESGQAGARAHLLSASAKLSSGDYPGSIRESIHAVEAVARTLEPSASSLEPALLQLSKKGQIHGALKAAFASLYGYTSDERGIRHSLLDASAAAVDEIDAVYMLGSCASFVTYLIGRAATARQ